VQLVGTEGGAISPRATCLARGNYLIWVSPFIRPWYVVCYEPVYYECGLLSTWLWSGLLWAGLLRTWSLSSKIRSGLNGHRNEHVVAPMVWTTPSEENPTHTKRHRSFRSKRPS